MTQATNTLSIAATLGNLFARNRGFATHPLHTEKSVTPEQPAPTIDLRARLAHEVGRLGTIQDSMGGFRIKTDKPLAFPFGRVLSMLAGRKLNVTVSQLDDTLIIEARP